MKKKSRLEDLHNDDIYELASLSNAIGPSKLPNTLQLPSGEKVRINLPSNNKDEGKSDAKILFKQSKKAILFFCLKKWVTVITLLGIHIKSI